jgi:opacity protein-like surface antigen
MKLVALFVVMLAIVRADVNNNYKPNPPTGNADRIVKVNNGGDYNVPQGSSQPLPEKSSNYRNPTVSLPSNTIEAGKPVEIKWNNTGDAGYVNIDLTNSCGLMNQPWTIATVPASQGSYNWEVPTFLKDGSCYNVRVWGHEQPRRGEDAGNSGVINVSNKNPNANSHFIVKPPGKVEPGKPCRISWDYSPVSSYPAMVDIRVCSKSEQGEKWTHIATVPCSQKEYIWTPTEDCLQGDKHHFQVSGGQITEGCNYGANSEVFVVGATTEENVTEVEEVVTQVVEEEATTTVNKNSAVMVKGAGMMVAAAIVVPLVMLL